MRLLLAISERCQRGCMFTHYCGTAADRCFPCSSLLRRTNRLMRVAFASRGDDDMCRCRSVASRRPHLLVLCIRMVVPIHAWSCVSQWWLAACGVRLLGSATSDGRSVSDSQVCRVPACSLSARSNFSGTLGIHGVENPQKLINSIKQKAIKD